MIDKLTKESFLFHFHINLNGDRALYIFLKLLENSFFLNVLH